LEYRRRKMGYQNWDEIRNATRRTPSQEELANIKNYSLIDFDGLTLPAGTYERKNFAFSDFTGGTIENCTFTRCNFSFALDMDELVSASGSAWSECNFTGAPKAELPDTEANLISNGCNVTPRGRDFTDEEIDNLFNPEEE
jgi:hypothetical protein